MSDSPTNTPPASKTRMRSPAYPLFGLGEAIKKVRAIWDVQRKNDGHIDSVISTLGYGGRNGASLRAIGALNHYGLTEESGAKDNRRIRLSDLAQDIIHLPEDDPKRADALKKAALSPAIHQVLWDRYQSQLPQESAVKGFLVRDKGYNENAALDVIKNYLDSFQVAKLGIVADNKLDDAAQQTDSTSQIQRTPPIGQFPPPPPPPAVQFPAIPVTQELPVLVGEGKIARIPFPMTEDDFELLIGTLNLWKKRIVKAAERPSVFDAFFGARPAAATHLYPRKAIWKNGDHDKDVTILGLIGEQNGEKFYQIEGSSTGIPASQVQFL